MDLEQKIYSGKHIFVFETSNSFYFTHCLFLFSGLFFLFTCDITKITQSKSIYFERKMGRMIVGGDGWGGGR